MAGVSFINQLPPQSLEIVPPAVSPGLRAYCEFLAFARAKSLTVAVHASEGVFGTLYGTLRAVNPN
jgi:hypothetical protein